MKLDEKKATLLQEIKELEDIKLEWEYELESIQKKYNIYNDALWAPFERDREVKRLEKKYLDYFKKPMLNVIDVAEFIGIDPRHFEELLKNGQTDFEYYRFPSSPTGDYYGISVESLARHMANNTQNVDYEWETR